MFRHTKFTPFSKLSRHKKRDLYIKLRGKIKKTVSDYGQNFTSHLVLNEEGRPSCYNQWFDFFFLGLDGVTIWNAVLCTASNAYWDAIQDLAFEESYRLCPIKENKESRFIPVYHNVTGKLLHYTMKEPEVEPELNNITRSQFVEEYSSKLIREDAGDTAPIFESFETDKKYYYGIGLHAVVDAPEINAEIIEAMIAKFRAIGEQDWKSQTPVDRSKLPTEIFKGVASRAIKS